MDRLKETSNLLIEINKFKDNKIGIHEIIMSISIFFDRIKFEKLSSADLKFLSYISNLVGIPHYFDMLYNFQTNLKKIDYIDLLTFSSFISEATLYKNDNIKFHKYQKVILENFQSGQKNRFFLSASTSFGKTFLVYEIIKKMKYKNVVLLFPTIALLSENLSKIRENIQYSEIKEKYKIHTLSETNISDGNNLFIYTPERFLSFLDRNYDQLKIDFVFIDEAYKIDNEYIVDEISEENERDVAYRLATYFSIKYKTDLLFAGPYIEFSKLINDSFNIFLEKNEIKLLNFNEIEIVGKSYYDIKGKKEINDGEIFINFEGAESKAKKLINMIKDLRSGDDSNNFIVYCSQKHLTEKYAMNLSLDSFFKDHDFSGYNSFVEHLENNFDKDWVVVQAIKRGIGVHHGLIPKYVQSEIIDLFNNNAIHTLISTTTITEGVNTSAKNLIILQDKKGIKTLKKFDAKNIAGRSGRFSKHYSGRVFIIQNAFKKTIDGEGSPIKHKYYDPLVGKNDIDIFYTETEFLNVEDLKKIVETEFEQKSRGIPDDIIDRFKVISKKDKITIFDGIKALSSSERKSIEDFIIETYGNLNLKFDGLQIILDTILPIVQNSKLKFLINEKKISKYDDKQYSVFIYLLHFYLKDGIKGSIKFNKKKLKINNAIRQSSDFAYNTLKYQAVKYLGVFNLMYRYILSTEKGTNFDESHGFDQLLLRLEYNALTQKGRLASDYGVPYKIITYYENEKASEIIKNSFDEYENIKFMKIDGILGET